MKCKLCGAPTKRKDTGLGIIRVFDETTKVKRATRDKVSAQHQTDTLSAFVETMARHYEGYLKAGRDPRFSMRVSTFKKAWELCAKDGVFKGNYQKKRTSRASQGLGAAKTPPRDFGTITHDGPLETALRPQKRGV